MNFFQKQQQTRRLFGLLQGDYIDTRYRDDYSISLQEAEELSAKVKRIQEVFEKHGREINGFAPT